jgi:predicted DNA-binding antitoxin AbrB/MazE fold protein
MLTTIEGIYRDGAVEILEPVDFPDGSKVIVTFLYQPSAKTIESAVTQEHLTLQEKALSEVWNSPEEDIYGEL